MYLGLLNGCGLLFFFVEFIIWAWLNTDWADSFVRHGLSGLKFLDWAVVILKILGPSKTGSPGPISSSDESGVSTTEIGRAHV